MPRPCYLFEAPRAAALDPLRYAYPRQREAFRMLLPEKGVRVQRASGDEPGQQITGRDPLGIAHQDRPLLPDSPSKSFAY